MQNGVEFVGFVGGMKKLLWLGKSWQVLAFRSRSNNRWNLGSLYKCPSCPYHSTIT